MILSISKQKKEEVVHSVIQNRSGLRLLAKCAKLSMPVALSVIMVYLLIQFLLPAFGAQGAAGIQKVNVAFIVSNVVLILVFGVVARLIFRLLVGNRTSLDLLERVDESLKLEAEVFHYEFRTRYHSSGDSRIIVEIPIRDLRDVQYDAKLCKLTFHGRMSSKVVEKYDPAEPNHPDSGNLNELTIYDYFEPSLMQTLSAKGLIH